jgi:exosortase
MANRLAAHLGPNDYLSVVMLGLVVLLWGIFLALFGTKAFRAALFPLVFLLLLVPIPDLLLDRVTLFLQLGSTELTDLLFRACGTPAFREGFRFTLPGVTIEIAKECSGIRSSVAMLVTVLLAGHLFLRTPGKQIVLLLAVFPVVVLKNAMRIVALSLLSVYVNPSFLHGDLHRDGGLLFFILGLAMIFPLFYWLLKEERKPQPEGRERVAGPLKTGGC